MPSIKDLNSLSREELALLWGCSTRTINRLPVIETLRHGAGQGSHYVWDECRLHIPGLQSQGSEGSEGDRARKLKAEADMAEMEAQTMALTLVNAAEVQATWEDFLSRLRTNLLGFPDRLIPLLEEAQTSRERLAIGKREMNTTLRDIVARETSGEPTP